MNKPTFKQVNFAGKINEIILYGRYSPDMQNPMSCDDQFRVIRRNLDRLGVDHRDAIEIKDEGISGTDNDRPGFQLILRKIKEGRVALLVVDEQSRLTRNLDAATLIKDLEFRGGRFISVNENIDSATPGWEYMASIKQAANSVAISETANRVRRGKEGRVRAGLSAGDFPYAYESHFLDDDPMKMFSSGIKPRKGIRIKECEALIVRRIFEVYVKGYSIGAIARELSQEGVPSNNLAGSSKWTHQLVRAILGNSKYIGVWRYGMTTTKRDARGKKRVIPTDLDAQVKMDFPERRIIAQELWDAAQKRLVKNKERWGLRPGQKSRAPISHHRGEFPSSMLSCMLRCPCGATMHNVGRQDERVFVCPVAKRKTGECDMHSYVPVERAKQRVLEAVLLELSQADEWQNEIYKAMQEHLATLTASTPNNLQTLQRRKDELDNKIKNLLKLAEAGAGDASSLIGRLAELEVEQKVVAGELKNLESMEDLMDSLPSLQWFDEQLKDMVNLFESETPEAMLLLRKLISPISVVPVIAIGKQRGFIRLSFDFNCAAAFQEVTSIHSTLPEWAMSDSKIQPLIKKITVDVGEPTKYNLLVPRLVNLRDGGMKWKDISEELGQSIGNLSCIYNRYKKGLLNQQIAQKDDAPSTPEASNQDSSTDG